MILLILGLSLGVGAGVLLEYSERRCAQDRLTTDLGVFWPLYLEMVQRVRVANLTVAHYEEYIAGVLEDPSSIGKGGYDIRGKGQEEP
jgi:hypothetical protein